MFMGAKKSEFFDGAFPLGGFQCDLSLAARHGSVPSTGTIIEASNDLPRLRFTRNNDRKTIKRASYHNDRRKKRKVEEDDAIHGWKE